MVCIFKYINFQFYKNSELKQFFDIAIKYIAVASIILILRLCLRSDLTGDMISWEREPWSLTSPQQSSEVELVDFERDVCQSQDVRYQR